ncbi:hypothetical protein Tco_0286508 [Tanacetum coccineum]
MCPHLRCITRHPNQYKEYLSGFWYTTKVLKNSKVWFSTPTGGILGEVGVTTFRIAIEANYLSHLSEYAKLPSIETIREWFPAIGYSGEIEAKGTLKKGLLPPSVLNWALKKNQPEGPHFTTHILAIYNAAEHVAFKAPKTSSKDEKATKGGSSSKETTGSPTSHSKKKKSGTAKDLNPSQPSASTPVVAGMHKEAMQANGGLISLGVTSEILPFYTLSLHHDMMLQQIQQLKLILENMLLMILYLNNMVLIKEPKTIQMIILLQETNNVEKEASFDQDEFNTSPDLSSFDDSTKNIKLDDLSKLVKDVKVKFIDLDSPKDDEPIIVQDEEEKGTLNLKLVKENEEAKTVVALLKAQQFFHIVGKAPELLASNQITGICREIKELKKYVHELEIELPRDLKEILTKLEEFTSTVCWGSASHKAGDQIPFLLRPPLNSQGDLSRTKAQEAMTREKLKKRGDHVHLIAEEIKDKSGIEESVKADMAKKEEELKNEESFDLLGIDLVTNVYKAKIKASDLHQAEWREVMQVLIVKNSRFDFDTPINRMQQKVDIGMSTVKHKAQVH